MFELKHGRINQPKRCDHNHKNEVNSPNILSNNDYQTSSQKFRQINILMMIFCSGNFFYRLNSENNIYLEMFLYLRTKYIKHLCCL